MKAAKIILNIVIIVIVLLTLSASIGTALFHKPVLLTVIKSNSMYPLWQRGDMLVIHNIDKTFPIHNGDMIIFHSETGPLASEGWIAHRVVGGNAQDGYVTQGDANDQSDQDSSIAPPIKREWIIGKVAMIGDQPLVLPKIGYLTLGVEQMKTARFVLPVIALLLAGIVAYMELTGRKKKKKNGKIDLPLIYIASGVTMIVVAMATMLINTQFITFSYEVGDQQGLLSGSAVGILQMGDVKSDNLSHLQNESFVPFIGLVDEHDPQLTVNHRSFILKHGETMNIKYTVTGKEKGHYDTPITVALLYPLLPPKIIHMLANINFWLAFTCVAIIPGLPFILYPLISRRMRRPIVRGIRKKWRF
jgi:signal peptidase I